MKRLLSILLAVLMVFALAGCNGASAAEADQTETDLEAEKSSIVYAHITYGKQYYAYRVGKYSTTSTYAVSIKVSGKGAADLAELIYDAEYTEIGNYPEQCWGYRIQFTDADDNQVGSTVYVTVDGRVHRNDVLSTVDNADELLALLSDLVQPTNLDAVSGD